MDICFFRILRYDTTMRKLGILFAVAFILEVAHGTYTGDSRSSSESCFRVMTGVETEQTLLKELQGVPSCPNFLTIRLQHSSLTAFPNNAFSRVRTRRFTLSLFNVSLSVLSPWIPDYSPFHGMVFVKWEVYVNKSVSMVGWRWAVLKDLPGEVTFHAENTELLYLRSEFGSVAGGRVTDIKINKCGLRWLGKNVFANFSQLHILQLRGNKLESIERSHLPANAPMFRTLDLGRNKLTSLPDDLCAGFKLEDVYFDGNNLAHYIHEFLCTMKLEFQKNTELPIACRCDLLLKTEDPDLQCLTEHGELVSMQMLKHTCT